MKARFTYQVSRPVEEVIAAYRETDFFIATMKHAGAVTIDIIEERALGDGGRFWKARVSESSRVPEFLRASEVDIYFNESEFHPEERRLSWRISPKIQANRVVLTGEIQLLEEDGGTRLVYEVTLEVKLPFFGAALEAFGLRKIGVECRHQAEFLDSWLTHA